MYSVSDDPIRAGFPHSDISGSQLVCQLPEAFRRLRRPSSPPTAKASTRCASPLDHIASETSSHRNTASLHSYIRSQARSPAAIAFAYQDNHPIINSQSPVHCSRSNHQPLPITRLLINSIVKQLAWVLMQRQAIGFCRGGKQPSAAPAWGRRAFDL